MHYVSRDEGRDEGHIEGKANLLTRQLEHRFGSLSEAVHACLAAAGDAELDAWGKAVLSAPSLEAVFVPPRH